MDQNSCDSYLHELVRPLHHMYFGGSEIQSVFSLLLTECHKEEKDYSFRRGKNRRLLKHRCDYYEETEASV